MLRPSNGMLIYNNKKRHEAFSISLFILLIYKKKARLLLQAGNKSVTKMAIMLPSVAGFQGAKIQLFSQSSSFLYVRCICLYG